MYICAFTNEIFPFIIFIFLVMTFSFSHREVLLTFLIKLFWLCWTLSLCLSVKLLISPSNLSESLAGECMLVCRVFFPFYYSRIRRWVWHRLLSNYDFCPGSWIMWDFVCALRLGSISHCPLTVPRVSPSGLQSQTSRILASQCRTPRLGSL